VNLSIKRLASAAAGAILVASLGVAGTGAPAHAASLSILWASQNQMAHVCKRIVDDGKQYGVICADILTGTDSTGFWARGQVEVSCASDPSGPSIHCPATDTVFGLFNESLAADPGMHQYIDGCGTMTSPFVGTVTYGPPCAGNGQRNYYQTGELHWPWTEACTTSDATAGNVVWSDVFGITSYPGSNAKTGIVLPDNPGNMWLLGDSFGGLLESGHYEICG
jgi:hypothetical protein